MADPSTAGPDVLVVGSINTDHVVVADTFPSPGQTVLGNAVRSSVGGKGANQAVAAALAGARTMFAGRVGDDAAGTRALAALRERGVDAALTGRLSEVDTGSAWITVAQDDNTIIVVPAANAEWPDDWPARDDAARAALDTASIVLCQLEIPVRVVQAARTAATGRFVLNAAPAAPLPDELLAGCDVLVVNEHELAVVAGEHDDRGVDVAVAQGRLRQRGVGAVVTTLGADGAVVSAAGDTYEVPSPAARVVDTTGAGDAFTGVLCARLAAGAALSEAVHWAVAAGSLAVRSAGTHDAYPDLAQLRALVTDELAS
ncbi:ribokinase [uncultured Jatrophihabitans sp.]|uniref:ribokinase n=1 Tax=uncultured Jatrophihabitans sp. TaxID=1610747 RepID=UPI0035CAF26D